VLRGLLIDSGDTLMHPRGGRWNPRFDFEDVVTRHVGELDDTRLPAAFAAGAEYLAASRLGSAGARADYHRVILAGLGVPEPSAALLGELDRPLPFTDIVEPFRDTAEGLARLRDGGWRIAVVANTSPRMVDVYRALDLDGLIETFVISEELGFSKPDPRMYRTASDRLGLPPNECVFVDDDPDNLAGADAAGYLVCGMDRYGGVHDDAWPWVRDLQELVAHLAMLRRR
jgi:FMN phosphatase YigB (HAD superfamily)